MNNHQTDNSVARLQQEEPSIEGEVFPVIEEKAVIGKEIVETGKVIISKRVTEHEKIIDEPLLQEKVSVERVAVNQFVETPPEIRHEGDTMIIPVVEEQLILKKRLFLVEELRVRKQVIESRQPQQVILRKEEVAVNRSSEAENPEPSRSTPNEFGTDNFRQKEENNDTYSSRNI